MLAIKKDFAVECWTAQIGRLSKGAFTGLLINRGPSMDPSARGLL